MQIEKYDFVAVSKYLDDIQNADVSSSALQKEDAVGVAIYALILVFLFIPTVVLFIVFLVNIFSGKSFVFELVWFCIIGGVWGTALAMIIFKSNDVKNNKIRVKYLKVGNMHSMIFYFYDKKIVYIDTSRESKITYNVEKSDIKVRRFDFNNMFWHLNNSEKDIKPLIKALDEQASKGIPNIDPYEYYNNTDNNSSSNTNDNQNKASSKKSKPKKFVDTNEFYPRGWYIKLSKKTGNTVVRYLDKQVHYSRYGSNRYPVKIEFKDGLLLKHANHTFDKINSDEFEIKLPKNFLHACKDSSFDLSSIECIKPTSEYVQY